MKEGGSAVDLPTLLLFWTDSVVFSGNLDCSKLSAAIHAIAGPCGKHSENGH